MTEKIFRKQYITVITNDPHCTSCDGWGILVDSEGDEWSCSCGEPTQVEVEVEVKDLGPDTIPF